MALGCRLVLVLIDRLPPVALPTPYDGSPTCAVDKRTAYEAVNVNGGCGGSHRRTDGWTKRRMASHVGRHDIHNSAAAATAAGLASDVEPRDR